MTATEDQMEMAVQAADISELHERGYLSTGILVFQD